MQKIIIEKWMLYELNLSFIEAGIYSVIHYFTTNVKALKKFNGGQKYLADTFKVTRLTIIRVLKKLLAKNLIIKNRAFNTNGKCFEYTTNPEFYNASTSPQPKTEQRKFMYSYQEIFDKFSVSHELQQTFWNFIKHCQANKHVLINDTLEAIIKQLNAMYSDKNLFTKQVLERFKVEHIKQAVSKGYYNISNNYLNSYMEARKQKDHIKPEDM